MIDALHPLPKNNKGLQKRQNKHFMKHTGARRGEKKHTASSERVRVIVSLTRHQVRRTNEHTTSARRQAKPKPSVHSLMAMRTILISFSYDS